MVTFSAQDTGPLSVCDEARLLHRNKWVRLERKHVKGEACTCSLPTYGDDATGRRDLSVWAFFWLTFTFFIMVRCWNKTLLTIQDRFRLSTSKTFSTRWRYDCTSRLGFRQSWTIGSLNSMLAHKYCIDPSKTLQSLVVWNQLFSFMDRNSH